MKHELKTLKCYFAPILSGEKTAEVRNNSDKGFQKGDIVEFVEIDEDKNETGMACIGMITYVFNWDQKENNVVFCFELEA
ncbi:MAG: DUF3850 domain-containing protein [Desulfobulbaceae bacterium]|jgi:uncharacterized protein YqfB (UPF0267 family)|nr:DUF3850 domain-containing protein [Desulfobulbaceae bacterium]